MTGLVEAISRLTEAQTAAAVWRDGPLFVLAGPGSGKTTVLTTRIAKLLDDSPGQNFRVMALTFTNKAAEEMAARVEAFVPNESNRVFVGTFHSFCMQLLQQHGSHIGIKPDFAIYAHEADRLDVLREAIRHEGLDPSDERFLGTIDKLMARLIAPDGAARRFRDPATGERVERVYAAYQQALARGNALDFGSLIARAYQLVSGYPGIAMHYRRTYAFWMFDEFQDTTDGQYRLIKALAGDKFRNVFAVADDDQIIFQWNGASFQQIQRFRADFSPEEIQLPTNFRCPPSIVVAANRLVSFNKQRTQSKLPLEAGKTHLKYDGEHIRVLRFSSDAAEVGAIAAGIASMGSANRGEIAVLARTRALLENMLAALTDAGVPAVIAQRRDDFRSPPFLWLSAALRLAARPLDRRALDALTGSANRWFGSGMISGDIAAVAEISSRSLLSEWALAAAALPDSRVQAVASLASALSDQPTTFRRFVEDVIAMVLGGDGADTPDIQEDHAAWQSLVVSIGQSIGRDAPLDRFLQELALRSKDPPVSADAVTLMTIHSAKGKEFDHVFLIGLAEDTLPSFHSVKAGEDSAEMEEERRNCFVAITRAREWLCLSYAERYRGFSKRPSRFLSEMGLQLPLEATA